MKEIKEEICSVFVCAVLVLTSPSFFGDFERLECRLLEEVSLSELLQAAAIGFGFHDDFSPAF